MTDEPILSVRNLKKHYPIKTGLLSRQMGAAKAVDGISFDIYPGETVGLVGESGCGKSTAATSIIGLEEPTSGEVIFNGGDRKGATRNQDASHPNDVTNFSKQELKQFRRQAQMIFQDPSSSFDPRMPVGTSIAEMLEVHGMDDKHQRRAIVEDLLERVGLSASDYDRYPHEFSGGQKQRIAIARALVLNPELIIADEPVSALDVSIKAEVLSLLKDLQDEFGLSMLFISHDLSVIRNTCDRVAVMYLGEIVEIGDTDEIFANPQHPYTEALLSSIPTPNPRVRGEGIELSGTVPNPENPPSGCRFHTRCHRVVQPDGLDLDQTDWRGVLNLRFKVEDRDIDIDKIKESIVSEGESTEGVPPRDIKQQLREEFGISEQLSDTDAETTLGDALDSLTNENYEQAEQTLSSAFVTPCEEKVPEYTDHGDGHKSACIRHQQKHESQTLVTHNE